MFAKLQALTRVIELQKIKKKTFRAENNENNRKRTKSVENSRKQPNKAETDHQTT